MPPEIPIATYRLQLTPQFGFDDARQIIPYLKALGISHVYASPFLKARTGTTHGYDIIDHSAFNLEFGGEDAFLRMSDALLAHDLGLILDFVPNHMAVHAADNVWWLDVLEWGPRSPYAKFFDIDWQMATGPPRVLLPILGRPYGDVLEAGEIDLRFDAAEGSFSAWYFEHRLPIGPNRYGEILQRVVAASEAKEYPAGQKLLDIAARYRGPRNPARGNAHALKLDLSAVPETAEIIERGLHIYRPKDGQPDAVQTLHHLLERQHYRTAFWRLAQSDINYRRFFDINSLAGLRVEEPVVFNAIHPLVFRLIAEGRLQGLRLDHIDGLRNPYQYLRRLQFDIESKLRKKAMYIIVEKILGDSETLAPARGLAGTTGYEWLNVITRVLLKDEGLERLDHIWRDASGSNLSFDAILPNAKRYVLRTILASEFTVLARLVARIAAGHYSTRDYTSEQLRDALELVVLKFPVYRTYVTAAGASSTDRAIIDKAIDEARAEWIGSDDSIFNFLRDTLTLDLVAPGRSRHSITRVRRFAFKIQQFTGPMMAKSLEDTAFYRYHRLLAQNEVGGDPRSSPLSTSDFHQTMAERLATVPNGLTATATHDTKRGEDARARLISLTELADEWSMHVRQWQTEAQRIKDELPEPKPTAAHEYMLYQALMGAWPLSGIDDQFVQRAQSYAIKAAREGKEETTWYSPDDGYESNLQRLVATLLDKSESPQFLTSFSAFAKRCALMGVLNSLTQLALKMTMPGVPDVYQGTELWDHSFVDPDNRRPVDFNLRQATLSGSAAAVPDWSALADVWPSGAIKLALTHELLVLRNRLPDVFLKGDYRPIEVTGPHQDEIIAFARVQNQDAVIVTVGRFFGRATRNGNTWPTASAYEATIDLREFDELRDIFNPGKPYVAADPVPTCLLFRHFPISILRAQLKTRRR